MLFKKCKKIFLASTIAILSLGSLSYAKSISDFKDLNSNAWYAEAIQDALDLKLFNGVSEDEFAPDLSITRGMFVTVLGRKANIGEQIGGYEFDDVDPNAYYSNGIKWAFRNGIVEGIGDGKFAPENPITRQDVAVIIDRYYNDNKENGDLDELDFSDKNDIAEYAIRSIKWAAKNNILKGSNGLVSPNQYMTRAEMAQIMMNLKDYENSESDNTDMDFDCKFSLDFAATDIESITINAHNKSFVISDPADLEYVHGKLSGVTTLKCIDLVNFNNQGYKFLLDIKLNDGVEKKLTVLSNDAIVVDNKKYIFQGPGVGNDFIKYIISKVKVFH